MRHILLACALAVTACGKSDDCSKLFDKMTSAMKDQLAGKDPAKDKDKFLEKCRKNIDKMKADPTMKCVLDASGDDAVKACLDKPMGDYMKKSRMNEAAIQLNALGKHLKAYYAENGAFPKGTSSVLPANPSTSKGCCGAAPDNKCPVSKEWETDPVWKTIDFRIDEPTMYRYKYDSADGKTFTATAVGDVDCDGDEATFTLSGSSEGGAPAVNLKIPEKGHY